MKEFFEQIRDKVEEIKNSPGTIFGLVFPYFLVVGLLLGLYFISNLEFITRQGVKPVILDSVKVQDLSFQESKLVPPVNINEIKEPTPELLTDGENIYKVNCASCHGDAGAGGGVASIGMNPAPKNFTSKEGWKNGTKLSSIYTTLKEGIAGSSMIAYDFLKPQEKFAVAHYIRKNFIPEPDNDTDDDLRALDALYNLSAGTFSPAQIPTLNAQEIILNESINENLKFEQFYKKLNESENKRFIETYLYNKKAALMLLMKDKNWRQSPNELKNLAVRNLENNIFSPKIAIVEDKELNRLFSSLILITN